MATKKVVEDASELGNQLMIAKRRLDDLWDANPAHRNEIYGQLVHIDLVTKDLIAATIDATTPAYDQAVSTLADANTELDRARQNIAGFVKAMEFVARAIDQIAALVA